MYSIRLCVCGPRVIGCNSKLVHVDWGRRGVKVGQVGGDEQTAVNHGERL